MNTAIHLNALAVGVPEYRMTQAEVAAQLGGASGDSQPLVERLFRNTGIDARHFVQPGPAYLTQQDWPERNAIYFQTAKALLEQVAVGALTEADLNADDIDTILCVSTTGIATPSLPSQMIASLGFRRNVLILPLFGYGCAGGVMGIQVARDMVAARPDSRVLLLTAELCSLAFHIGDRSKKAMIAATLFADGASAAVISAAPQGPRLGTFSQVTWPDTRGLMGWDIDDFGLGLVLSPDIPRFVAREFAPVVKEFLSANRLDANAIAEPACHPGGRKVIEAIEAQFPHLPDGLATTRRIYAGYGNMSSPTVHFVLKQLLGGNGPLLLTALGPGFSGALGIIER